MMALGMNIRAARKKKGFTQEELALQVGVTSQAVSRWESGAGLPDISMIVPLARILSVSADTLFGLEETKQDEAIYMEIKHVYEEIVKMASSPADPEQKHWKQIRQTIYTALVLRRGQRSIADTQTLQDMIRRDGRDTETRQFNVEHR